MKSKFMKLHNEQEQKTGKEVLKSNKTSEAANMNNAMIRRPLC